MRKKTPEITICDEIDIKLFNEAEQNTFYNALLFFLQRLYIYTVRSNNGA